MPIRFRCQLCHQLLGIARRKAGSRVRCPTCQREVLVPATSSVLEHSDDDSHLDPRPSEEVPTRTAARSGGPQSLFERDDFEALLRGPASAATEGARSLASNQTPVPSARQPTPPPLPRDEAASPVTPHAGADQASSNGAPAPALVLSSARATVLGVIVVLLLAIAFGAGVLVGRYYLG